MYLPSMSFLSTFYIPSSLLGTRWAVMSMQCERAVVGRQIQSSTSAQALVEK